MVECGVEAQALAQTWHGTAEQSSAHAQVPPRIQWFVFLSATTPMPCCFASSIARLAQREALEGPAPW